MTISSLHILVNHNCQSWCILISKCKVAINTKNQMMKPWEYHQFTWEVFNHRRSLIRPQLEVPKNCQWSENIPINNPMHCSDLSQGNVLMWMYLIFTLSRFLIQMLWGISSPHLLEMKIKFKVCQELWQFISPTSSNNSMNSCCSCCYTLDSFFVCWQSLLEPLSMKLSESKMWGKGTSCLSNRNINQYI